MKHAEHSGRYAPSLFHLSIPWHVMPMNILYLFWFIKYKNHNIHEIIHTNLHCRTDMFSWQITFLKYY